jgi:glycine/D-amino acid oxidase-like deaminating enzyme
LAVGLTVPPGREISRVGVVGAGMMGAGIAEVCARASLDVVVCERDAAAAAQGRQRVVASMGRARDRKKLDDAELAAAPSSRSGSPMRRRTSPTASRCSPPLVSTPRRSAACTGRA